LGLKQLHIILFALVFSMLCNGLLNAQLTFIENQGQWHEEVEFRTEIPGAFAYFSQNKITYNLYEPDLMTYFHPGGKKLAPKTDFWMHAYEVEFLHCNATAPKGNKPTEYYHNYFLSENQNEWAMGVQPYKQMSYSELYEGVDMLVYSSAAGMKYDFKIKPGGSPEQISLKISGADKVSLINGELHISTKVNKVVESKPYTYQLIDGRIKVVKSNYVLKGNVVSFQIGEYNPAYDLIIDPELILATTTGSTSSNFGFTATYDQDENLIAGGNVFSNGFPTTLGAFQTTFGGAYSDAFVTKFNADGSQLLYSTYIGGSDNERPHSLIASLDNDIYVMGTTGSSNFPVTNGAYDTTFNGGSSIDIATSLGDHDNGCDIFVAKISGTTGALLACTYVGGTGNDGLNSSGALEYNYADVFRGEIIVEDDEDVFITTSSSSSDFPTTSLSAQPDYGGGETDAVVFKLNSTLNVMQWSTYYGGLGDDSGYSLQPDSEGNLYLVGGSNSFSLETTPGVLNEGNPGGVSGYIAKFNELGSELLAATYMGTSSYDQTYFVQLDPDDDLYVVGQTEGVYTIQGDVYSNPNSGQFIHKLSNDLATSLWSTTIGTGSGEVDISPTAFLVSDCNKIFITGWGGSTNAISQANFSTTSGLPITPDAYQSSTDGSDFYLAVLEEEATGLLYATYFGGGVSNEHVDGGTSKFSKDGVVYQAVCSGCGSNDDFPTTSTAWSSQNNTTNCDLGVFKFNLGRAEVEIGLDSPPQVCIGDEIQLTNLSDQELEIEWNFGNDQTSNSNDPLISYDAEGFYQITLTGNDDTGCLDGNIDAVEVEVVGGVNPEIIAPENICAGEIAEIQGVASEAAYWENNPVISSATEMTQIITPESSVTIELTDSNMCEEETVSHTIEVDQLELEIEYPEQICLGDEVNLVAIGGSIFEWSDENENILGENNALLITPEATSAYTIYSATDAGCEGEESFSIEVIESSPGGLDYGPVFSCENEDLVLTAANGDSWLWTPGNLTTQSITVNLEESQSYEVLISNICGSGTDEVLVEVGAAEASVMEPDSICLNEELLLTASGGVAYQWTNLNTGEVLPNPNVSPTENTAYQVIVADQNGCVDSTSTFITVLPLPFVDAGANIEVMFLDTAILDGSVDTDTYYWTTHPDLSCLTCLDPTVYPSQNQWYFLNAIDEFGCKNYDAVLVQVTGPLFVPNSFTPDGDGLNDVFIADGLLVEGFQMQIFDRWGELIFESNDPKIGWDGTFKGHEPIIDTYTWRITYKDFKYGRKIAVGHVTVVE